jgi:uncharacterized membrane protein YeaQ/YmgE (transglycosylase-associated protein family)
MATNGMLYFLVIGGLAGWLAGKITRGHGFGLIGDIGVGVIGAVLGGFVFGVLGLTSYSFLGSLVTATVGAILLLFLVRHARRHSLR